MLTQTPSRLTHPASIKSRDAVGFLKARDFLRTRAIAAEPVTDNAMAKSESARRRDYCPVTRPYQPELSRCSDANGPTTIRIALRQPPELRRRQAPRLKACA
jgi:hypothetical protein